VIGRHSGHLPLWSFLRQTPLTRPGRAARLLRASVERSDRAARFAPRACRPDPRADRLRDRAHPCRHHRRGSRGARARRVPGPCPHLHRRSARADVPARYVSGYLMMDDRIEQEATHAWAEAHVEGLGWVGFDMSNGISPDPRYVRVATGATIAMRRRHRASASGRRDRGPARGSGGGTADGGTVRPRQALPWPLAARDANQAGAGERRR
jgi:hypothetical protein